jgi:phosphatidylglycerol:prolipoprotein diacylglycerol transferase
MEEILMKSDFLVDFPGLGINDLPVNRELFTIFGQSVYWYGLLIALAIIICLLLATRKAKDFGLKSDDIIDTFIILIPFMIVFARLYYVVFEWDYYSTDLTRIFNTRHGGLAFYGGVIGGALAIFIVTKYKKIKFYKLIDFLAVYIPLGQAIGRWGNFFNQEAFGTNTNLPWGMYSNETQRYLTQIGGYNPAMPVHPTFLYEFIANMIIFLILLKLRKKAKAPFVLTFSYLGMYGLVRFFVESIRTDALYIGNSNIRVSMLLSAVLVALSVIYIVIAQKRSEKAELNQALADAENDYSDQPDIDDENSAAASFDDSSDFIVIDDENSAADSGPDKADDSEADNDPEKNS